MMHLGKIVAIAAVTVVAAAGTAIAGNTHTVNSVYHGLGDGANSNFYVHPFTDTSASTRKLTYLGSDPCYYTCTYVSGSATHQHISWDTNPYSECRYYSDHSSDSPYYLNRHRHYHHYNCA